MRPHAGLLAATIALAVPGPAGAQHSHGGGMDMPQHQEKHEDAPPRLPPGLRPPGGPREIQILVVDYGFSPPEIQADQGEEVVLELRRSDDVHCGGGLAIPERKISVDLPVGETVPVTLKLERAETIQLQCVNEDTQARIVVAPRR